ncbi:MAG: sigma-54 factor interaction domain-containing protein, partial [Planctomycetota bacterium]
NVRLRTRSSAAEELIGGSPAMQVLRERIAKLAPRPFPVLVLGESGAGKELVALALHRQSPRREAPLTSPGRV